MNVHKSGNLQTICTMPDVTFYHYVGDFFNILKAFIGTNYQAVPFAFKNSGLLFGILGVFGIASLTEHCCQLMIRCKYYVIDQILEEETFKGQLSENELTDLRKQLGKTLGYGDIGKKVFGTWCYHLIQIAVWFTQYTTCMAYFIFIGNTVYEMFPTVPVPVNINNDSRPIQSLEHSGYGIPMLNIHFISQRKLKMELSHSLNMVAFSPKRNTELYHELCQNSSGKLNSLHSDGNLLNENNLRRNNSLTILNDLCYNTTSMPNSSLTVHGMTIYTNLTTTASTKQTTSLPTAPPTPNMRWITSAPDLKLVVLFPLPFFLLTSIIKKVRLIAPFSGIATLFLGIGAVSVFAFLLHGFTLCSGGFHWVRFSTLPLFIGQLISAYEGIGCVIPIESSMEGNRWIFPGFLRAAVYIVFVILCSFGIVGYLRFGTLVEQIVVLNMTQHTPLSVFVDITLIISVLFTYPLQCFPTIEITETYIFSFISWMSSNKRNGKRLEYDEIDSERSNIQQDSSVDDRGLLDSVSSLDASLTKASVNAIQSSAPNWQRNILRIVLTLCIVACSILCRNAYAYLSAFTGAVGCSLLAYIIPCAVHLKVKWENLSDKNKVKDILIIGFSCVASILTLMSIVQAIVSGEIL